MPPCLDNDRNLCRKPVEECVVQAPIPEGCNVVFKDGVYKNATIYVENGCIVKIEDGIPFVYDPNVCCSTTNNGCACDLHLQSNSGEHSADCGCGCGEGNFNKGEKGDPGESVEISIGQVQTVSAAEKAEVWLSGTPTKQILNFKIPQGVSGVTPTVDYNQLTQLVVQQIEDENGGLYVTRVVGADSDQGLVVTTQTLDGGQVVVRAGYTQKFMSDLYTFIYEELKLAEFNSIKQRLTEIENRLNITNPTP